MPANYEDDDPRKWTPSQSKKFRKIMKDRLPLPCSKCGQEVDGSEPWAVDHVSPRAFMDSVEEVEDISNMAVAHRRCNSVAGAQLGVAMRRNFKVVKGGRSLGSSSNPARDHPAVYDPAPPTTVEQPLVMTEDGYPLPRFMSMPHRNAVGSYGPEAIAWIRERRLSDDLIPDDEKEPLPAWSLILERALEHDADGALCWKIVVLTVPRQSTKSSLAAELMAWRLCHADLFGERQILVHSANKLQAAIRIQEDMHPWAEGAGMKVARRTGQERIIHPNHSRWEITSLTAAYGSRPSFAFLDECFDVPRELVEKAILPAQARRKSPQIWLVSTANSICTDLMPQYMRQARDGSDRVCLIDWGLPVGADPSSRESWRHSNPFPSEAYLDLVEANVHSKDWSAQWLNEWPDVVTSARRDEFVAPGWESLQACEVPDPGRGGTVVIDEALDGSCFGRLVLLDGNVYYRQFARLDEAVARANHAEAVIVGLTMVQPCMKAGLRVAPIRYGAKETRIYTPLLQNTVREGQLRHDHDSDMLVQMSTAVVIESESGKTISSKRSENPVLSPKLLAWALGFERSRVEVRPMIF